MDYSYDLDDVKGNAGVSQGDDPFETKQDRKYRRLKELEKEGQGYVALGHSTDTNGVNFWFWSRPQNKIIQSSDSTLGKKIWLFSVAGVEYAKLRWSIEKFDKDGECSGEVFDACAAAEDLIIAAQSAGPWSPVGAVRGSGAWYGGPETLIVNTKDGVFSVTGDKFEPIDRCSPLSRHVYVATQYGSIANEEASVDEVRSLLNVVTKSWNWRRVSDGYLSLGWLLMQPYCAALDDGRAHLYLTGQSGAGKSYLQQYFSAVLEGWALRVESGRESSVAGVRQAVKSESITVLLDEMEPKQGGSEIEREKLNTVIRGMLQMLRSAYSQSRTGSISAVKGSASGTAQVFDIRISGMIAGITEGDLEQADRNRFLRVCLNSLPRDESGNLINEIPPLPDCDLGPRLFRRMWTRWPSFTGLRRQIMPLIRHGEERMRMTLAGPIAAILIATEKGIEDDSARRLIEMINGDYCGPESVDDARPDAENALARLLDLNMRVQREGMTAIDAPLSEIIAQAVIEGGGGKGRGAGGDFGAALRARGMTVTKEDGKIRLFIADKHIEFEQFSKPVGFPNLATLLRQTPGAAQTQRRGGIDTRVRIGCAGLRSGVWVDTAISA